MFPNVKGIQDLRVQSQGTKMPSSTSIKGGAKGNSTANFQPFLLNQNACHPQNSGRSVKGTHRLVLLALQGTGPHAIVTNSCMVMLTSQHLMQHYMSPARQSADPNPLPPRLAALKSIMPSRGSMEKRPSAIKPPDIRQQLGMVGYFVIFHIVPPSGVHGFSFQDFSPVLRLNKIYWTKKYPQNSMESLRI